MSSRSIREFRSGILSTMSYKSALWFVRLPTSPGEISQTMRSWYNASVWLLQLYLETNFLDTLLLQYEYNWQLQRLKLTQLSYSFLSNAYNTVYTKYFLRHVFLFKKRVELIYFLFLLKFSWCVKLISWLKERAAKTSNVIKMIETNLRSRMQIKIWSPSSNWLFRVLLVDILT